MITPYLSKPLGPVVRVQSLQCGHRSVVGIGGNLDGFLQHHNKSLKLVEGGKIQAGNSTRCGSSWKSHSADVGASLTRQISNKCREAAPSLNLLPLLFNT
jgi:hypothetical protein